jgi:hypothetical protein
MAGRDEGYIPEDQAASDSRMKRVRLKVLVGKTLALYFSRWKQHFLTALPPAILAVLVYAVAPVFLRAIRHGVRPVPGPDLWLAVIEAVPVQLLEFCLPWLLTAYAFAAVSCSLLPGSMGREHAIYDAYTLARERIRPILAVGLITFGLALVGGIVSIFCAVTLTRGPSVPREYRGVAAEVIFTAGLIAWMTLLARTSLSIPCLMDRLEISAWQAIKTTSRLTDGYEPFFFLLIAPTISLSVLVPLLCRQAFAQLWDRGLINGTGYRWLGYGMDVIAAAALETLAFVGFTILYLELAQLADDKVQGDVPSEAMSAAVIGPR